jgi:DNA-binding PadR family transcriptional regulator
VSSIRLFILASLEERGEMHGHALRLLAEEEHVESWADVSVGAIYGAIKRLAAEDLIASVRTEREGNYPERQVYGITDEGRESLSAIRREALETIVLRPDPVDLALARLGEDDIDELQSILEDRAAELRARIEAEGVHQKKIAQYLTLTEKHVIRHDVHRLQAELAWHEELLGALPEIIADEKSRKAPPK